MFHSYVLSNFWVTLYLTQQCHKQLILDILWPIIIIVIKYRSQHDKGSNFELTKDIVTGELWEDICSLEKMTARYRECTIYPAPLVMLGPDVTGDDRSSSFDNHTPQVMMVVTVTINYCDDKYRKQRPDLWGHGVKKDSQLREINQCGGLFWVYRRPMVLHVSSWSVKGCVIYIESRSMSIWQPSTPPVGICLSRWQPFGCTGAHASNGIDD